jgi:tRNA (guanine37-N1)-methyltransferase
MRVGILTAFPDMFDGPFAEGMIRIARESGQLEVEMIDYRAFTTDRHRTIDDAPFGGGAGMILKPEPVIGAMEAADASAGGRSRRILLGPTGERFDQARARELAAEPRLTLVTGRYKDVDERVRSEIDEELSVGDYILSGGELAAMIVVDSVARLLPGVVGDSESVDSDSFESPRLDAPYYTRPASFRGREVPEVLRSGHHGRVEEWRAKEGLRRTLLWRPDLLEEGTLDADDRRRLREIREEMNAHVGRLLDDDR